MKIPFTNIEITRGVQKALSRPLALPSAQRFYNAANPSAFNGPAPAMAVPPDYIVFTQQRRLRAKSRSMYQNSPHIRRFTQMLRTNCIGPHGILLSPAVLNPATGLLDTAVNQLLNQAFEEFGQAENCTVLGNLNWTEFQRLAVSTLAIDGEFFCIMHRGPDVNDSGFALELIDPELIDVQYRSVVPGGYVEAGIEYDNVTNKPVAYWVTQLPKTGLPSYSYFAGTKVRIPVAQMLHLYSPETVGQRRGMPWTSTAADSVSMSDAFAEASLVAARVAASSGGFITTPGGTDFQGDYGDQTGNVEYEVSPGMIRQLPIGTSFTAYDPKQPTTTYESFEKNVIRKIASGLGVSANSLGSDSEHFNYASGRVFLAEEHTQYRIIQDLILHKLLRPIYNNWLEAQLLQGNLSIAGKNGAPYILKYSDLSKYKTVKAIKPGFQPIDETKHTSANIAGVVQGLKSRSEIIREEGKNPADVWTEIAAERKFIADLGIVIEGPGTSDNVKESIAD